VYDDNIGNQFEQNFPRIHFYAHVKFT